MRIQGLNSIIILLAFQFWTCTLFLQALKKMSQPIQPIRVAKWQPHPDQIQKIRTARAGTRSWQPLLGNQKSIFNTFSGFRISATNRCKNSDTISSRIKWKGTIRISRCWAKPRKRFQRSVLIRDKVRDIVNSFSQISIVKLPKGYGINRIWKTPGVILKQLIITTKTTTWLNTGVANC